MSLNRARIHLKFKMAFFSTLLVAFVALSMITYIRQGQKHAIIEKEEVSQINTVRALGQVVRQAIIMDDDTDIVSYIALLQKSLTTVYAMVLYEDGRVRVHTDPTMIDKKLDDDPTRKALDNKNRQKPLIQRLTSADGREIVDISMPVFIGFDPEKYEGTVRIGFDKNAIDKEIQVSLREVDRRIWEAFLFAFVLGIAGAFVLATFITRPIEKLREGSHKIGEGKLDHRIVIRSNDELGELADDFNVMAQKLGELDEMKRDFVSNVTHELRSPMTSIRGYMDLLLQETDGPLNTTQKDYLSIIKNSAVRLGRFIDNLLDVAKIESNKLKLTPEILNVHQLAHEMEVLFRPQLEEKKLSFKNEVPAKLAAAFADKDKLAEVFINLTSNAIKFTPEGGRIEIHAKEADNHLELSVQDNGPGIPADMIGKLFNKFEQVKSTQGLARKHKGTGLGLTIAKGIVEAHGGKIWIQSPALSGLGTAFFFTIPKLTAELKEKISKR